MNAAGGLRTTEKDAADRAALAFVGWSARPIAERNAYVRRLQAQIAARQEELAAILSSETGKPVTEVVSQEITAALEMLRFIRKTYPQWLKEKRIRYGRPGFLSKSNHLRFEPLGAIAVIGPANYPFSFPVMQACAALACGNTVVLKPSDRAPRTAAMIKSLLEAAGFPPGVLEVVEGGEEIAATIIAHPGIRKIFFTGSSETGRKVVRQCGRFFKPCLLELGGVGAAIVAEDADLRRTARGLAWSAFSAAGGSCIGTKRVFVLSAVGSALVDYLKEEISRLRAGDPGDPSTDIGLRPDPRTEQTRMDLVRDAVERGALAWTPDGEMAFDRLQDIRGPIVVWKTKPGMAVLRPEESLRGSILCLREVESDEQGILEANASAFGLGATVWSRNRGRAEAVARALRTGMVWINDAGVGLPPFPWGGTKESGWGRLFAKESLSELTSLKVVSRERRRSSTPKFWWFPYTAKKYRTLLSLNRLVYGSGPGSVPGRLFRRRGLPFPLRFPARETPHATVETNRTCNIRCRHCYNLDRSSMKSLAEVKSDIDAILRLRNVQALTLLGGEPTLHPELAEIVAYVRSLGRKCLLLTNGVILAGREGDGLLDRLVAAGIDKVLVHIDSGQNHVHPDLDRARSDVFRKLEARKTTFSLALTIDRESAGEIPSLVRRYASFRYFDGILSLVARDGLRNRESDPRLEDEAERIAGDLGLRPISFIPSNLASERARWLIYFYLMNAATGAAYGLSSEICGIFGWFYRIVRRRRFFIFRTHPRLNRWLVLPLGLAGAVFRPGQAGTFVRLLRKSTGLRALRLQQIIIQHPAEYNERLGRYEFCYHCPDATLRNGRLVPVCIADYIDPPAGQESSAIPDLIREVRNHLR